MRNGKAKVVIGAPEQLALNDMVAVKEALESRGAIVAASRADIFFHFEKFESECKGGTHLILVIDNNEFPHERKMLATARAARIQRIAFICIGSCAALKRHEKLIEERRVGLVVRRSHRDAIDAKVPYHLVAEDLKKSAREIARAVLIG